MSAWRLRPWAARRSRSPRHRNVLCLQEFHQPLMRALAADAGLLHAAERRRRIGDEPAVEADHTEVEPLGDAHAAAEVLSIQVSNEAIFGVVRTRHDFVLGLEGLQSRD